MNVKKAIVLIVDEASDNLIEMNRLLQKQYEVRLANSGRAALEIMQTVPRPHLVVVDAGLNDLDGSERGAPGWAPLPAERPC